MTLEEELAEIVKQMKVRGVEFDPGLSDAEVAEIEQTCQFQFPSDLRMFLQLGVPLRWVEHHNGDRVDERFPKWRENPLEIISDAREWAWGTFSFDIENNVFWMDE